MSNAIHAVARSMPPLSTIIGPINRITNGSLHFYKSLIQATKAASEFERMNSMSDARLAAEGLTREELPNHIADKYLNF
ncbi:MAG: hypothetical protein ACR2PG_26425 [Hyphomicrobiaceae bacterium]